MTDLKEHFSLIMWLVGALSAGLLASLSYIARQFIKELQTDREQRQHTMDAFAHKIDKIEGYLENITEELFERVRKAEESVSNLWSEHRTIKELGKCALMGREDHK